jgi:hypothetical protein
MPHRFSEPVLSGVGGFVLGALSVLMLSGRDLPVPPPAGTAWTALGVGLLGAAAFVALTLTVGRRSRQKRELVRSAVRSGRLPDTDDAVLRRVLSERADRLVVLRWSLLLGGALQLLVAGSHLLSPARTDSIYSRTFWALDIAFWVVVAVVWIVRARWERPKVLRLLAELDEREAQRVGA